ncbi:MAG: rhodanese-related sulfurtransferase [Rickettsiales bacterium]|nr:rhodanese-related sulfurtransferase [Rickettsiales bacterium]
MTIHKDSIEIRAFYRFVDVPNFEELQEPMRDFCKSIGLKGTILLAHEGINSTIAAPKEVMEKFWDYLNRITYFKNIPYKVSFADHQPFDRMRVRLKKEIVRMGIEDLDISKRGEYVRGEEWDKLISDPEVLLVDTRNSYEIAIGTFENAIDPKTEDFRSFPKWVEENLDPKKHKKVAMFCTGGIRCEKSTSLLKNMGFENVYHLDGGILQYLEDTNNKNNKWQGKCFVFDDRIAVDEFLKPVEGHIICKKCSRPLEISQEMRNKNNKGVSCEMIGLTCVEFAH